MNPKHLVGCIIPPNYSVVAKKLINFSFVSLALIASSCDGGRTRTTKPASDTILYSKTAYNLFVENSGSLKGYFNGNSTAKVLIKEYYDRISQDLEKEDTISLNYINETVKPVNQSIYSFLSGIQNNCNAQYSKIDDILSMAINATNTENVQLIISDFCFTSNTGDFRTAQSGITKIFSKKIKSDSNYAVIIKQFDSDFKGKYYPGSLQYEGNRPLYIWIMGYNAKLKGLLDLDIKEESKTIYLQNKQTVQAVIKAKKSRMVNKGDNSINVKDWDAERNGTGYKLNIELDLSKLLIDEELVLDAMNYDISNNYKIENIEYSDNGKYSFIISTPKPSPGVLGIKYSQQIPSWVIKSNFEGSGLPKSSQTLGIKALICGAYDAFSPKKENNIVFSSSITIK